MSKRNESKRKSIKKVPESVILGYVKCERCGYEKFVFSAYFKCEQCGYKKYRKTTIEEDLLQECIVNGGNTYFSHGSFLLDNELSGH